MFIAFKTPTVILTKYTPFISTSVIPPFRRHLHTTQSASPHPPPPPFQWPAKPLHQLTPYEIFGQTHSTPYNKATYYNLVKIYHPDIQQTPTDPSHNISKVVRIERFRLIVAANNILSDPAKKRAYDAFGIGWTAAHAHSPDGPFQQGMKRRTTTQAYAAGPWKTSPANNGTWEDWEKWYAAEGYSSYSSTSSAKSEPWTSHSNFVSIILVLSFVGIAIQLVRVDQYSNSFEERRDKQHRNISKDLWRLKKEALSEQRQERVETFLKMRDPGGYGGGVEKVREERYRKLLPAPEVCLSEGTRGKDSH